MAYLEAGVGEEAEVLRTGGRAGGETGQGQEAGAWRAEGMCVCFGEAPAGCRVHTPPPHVMHLAYVLQHDAMWPSAWHGTAGLCRKRVQGTKAQQPQAGARCTRVPHSCMPCPCLHAALPNYPSTAAQPHTPFPTGQSPFLRPGFGARPPVQSPALRRAPDHTPHSAAFMHAPAPCQAHAQLPTHPPAQRSGSSPWPCTRPPGAAGTPRRWSSAQTCRASPPPPPPPGPKPP